MQIIRFREFVYNRKTGEVFGRSFKSWAKIAAFFGVFYTVVGGIFAAHLSVFITISPQPAENIAPWNFGRYAYSNYPNAKIALVSIPRTIQYDGTAATLSDADKLRIENLLESANQSGVSNQCLNEGNHYGFTVGQPCILVHITRVFTWTPDLIMNSNLTDAAMLPILCNATSSEEVMGIESLVVAEPSGIPLNLSNNADSRSFPFRNQPNYITPVMGLMLNLTQLSPPPTLHTFDITVSCSLDYSAMDMTKPTDEVLQRNFEIPEDATTVIQVTSQN